MTDIWLMGEINAASAARTVAEVQSARGDLRFYVECDGGEYNAALAIGVGMRGFEGNIEAIVLRADSAAMIPVMACTKITMALDSSMLLHAVMLQGAVNRHDLAAAEDELRSVERQLSEVFALRSKTHPATFFSYLASLNAGEGTRLSAEDCIRYGLADEISVWPASHFRGLRDRRRTPENPRREISATVGDARRRFYERREERIAAAMQEAGAHGTRTRFVKML